MSSVKADPEAMAVMLLYGEERKSHTRKMLGCPKAG
jgi:hypothetical protein